MKDRTLIWRRVASNPLWLQARLSRVHNPSTFMQSMLPERAARIDDPQYRQVVTWIRETGFPAQILPQGILAFEREEQITLFLLKWS